MKKKPLGLYEERGEAVCAAAGHSRRTPGGFSQPLFQVQGHCRPSKEDFPPPLVKI